MNPLHRLLSTLVIYQQEDYSLRRWWKWWIHHPFTTFSVLKKPIQWTLWMRLLLVSGLSAWLGIAGFLLFFSLYSPLLWILIVWLLPEIIFLLGLLPVSPIQILVHRKREKLIEAAIGRNKRIIKIGVTGSYGKTSVKEILFSILDNDDYSLMTPDNFNTTGGMARMVQSELNAAHRYFIAEMGAYYQNDIHHLSTLIKPDWGIITSVGPQHLERFGSIALIAATKSELITALPKKKALINWDSQPLHDYLLSMKLNDSVVKLSQLDTTADFFLSHTRLTKSGLSFRLSYKSKEYTFTAPLFGSANIINCALAAAMGILLDLPETIIGKGLQNTLPIPHRLALRIQDKATIIDNTYSSNFDGFSSLMADLKKVKGTKVVMTPGVVELGSAEAKLHHSLGLQMANVFDEVCLIGTTARTKAMALGLKQAGFKGKLSYLTEDYAVYHQTMQQLSKSYNWIVLENDLPEAYL